MDMLSYLLGKKGGGGSVDEYFNTTLGMGTVYSPSYPDIFKKLPKLTADYNISFAFKNYTLNFLPVVDASKTISFDSMFSSDNRNLKKLDFTTWNLPNNVVLSSNKSMTFSNMFRGNYFEEIDLSNLGKITGSLVYTNQMFQQCGGLKKVDLSNFCVEVPTGSTPTINANQMFYMATSLEEIDMSSFDFTVLTSFNDMFYQVPTDCLILVKNQAQLDWFTTNFSTMTNVQIKQ